MRTRRRPNDEQTEADPSRLSTTGWMVCGSR